MSNATILDLPPVTLPLDAPNSFLEISVLEAGVEVSRRVAADNIGAGAGGLAGLSDVDLAGQAQFDLLVNVDGTNWEDTAGKLTYDTVTGALSIVDPGGTDTFSITPDGTNVTLDVGAHSGLNIENASIIRINGGGVNLRDGSSLTILDSTNARSVAFNWSIPDFLLNPDSLTEQIVFNFSGVLTNQGLRTNRPFWFNEQAAAGDTTAARGQFWVRDDVPNVPMFTNDDDVDFVLNQDAYFALTATDRVVGSNAGSSQTGDSVFLANALAGDVNIADNVIAIGSSALAVAAQLDFDGTIAIGQNAGALLTDTRDPWVIIGKDAAANMPGAAFHDGNTVIGTEALLNNTSTNMQGVTVLGHRAGFRINGAVAVTGSTIIGFEAAGDGTPQTASVTNSVIIGFRALSNYGPTQVGNLVVIGRNAGQDISGDDDSVIIGADAFLQGSGGDDSVFIGSSCYGSATGSMKSVYIGQAAGGSTALGDFNVVIGSQSLTTPGATGLDHSVMLGFSVGNDIGSETALFLVESTQGTTSFVNRPYLYGSTLNGNLALLSVNDTSTQDENGTRNIPSWGSANGVWTMSGAGTDLGATGDADFMHSWIRNADTALMLQFPSDETISLLHNGTDSIFANSVGAMVFSPNSVEGLRLAEDNSGVLQVPSAAVTITAFAGGGQGSATALIHSYNVITVVATAGDSVRLPDVFSVNSLVYIKNDDPADAADVFPAVGDDLGAGLNTAVSLPAGESVTFIATAGSSTWTELIVAPGSAPITVATSLLATNPAGPAIVDEAATSLNPTIIVNQAELDTGFGWTSADRMSAVGGGVLIAEFLNVGGVHQFIIPQQDNASFPSVAFGDGDTGWYENADDFLSLAHGGVRTWATSASVIQGIVAGSVSLRNELASATNPTVNPAGDAGTGLGSAGTGAVSIITSSVESLRFTAGSGSQSGGALHSPSADLTITALPGGGQSGATVLKHSYNVVTTVATFNDSVQLPSVFAINTTVTVKNEGAAQLAIFPAAGDDAGEGANTLVPLQTGNSITFIATVADSTWTLLDTGGIATALLGLNNNGPQIADILATLTVPNLIPNKPDVDTGTGWGGNDILVHIAGGVEAQQFRELNSGVVFAPHASLAVTAFAGGGQGSATALVSSYNVITTVATAGDSVRLPDIYSTNAVIYIKNDDAAEACDVFPASGDDLGAGVNTAVSLAAGASASFICTVASSTWTPFIVDAAPTVPTSLVASNAAGPEIEDAAATAANPTLIPNRANNTDGVGSAGAGSVSLIALALEAVRYTGLSGQVLTIPDRQSVVAEDTLFTQAAATQISSSLTIIDSPEEAAGTKLPLVFPVDTIIEFNYPDPSDSEEGTTLYPGVGDDLGDGVNVARIMPVGSWKFRATVADSTWEQMAQGATSVASRDATGPAIIDLGANGDPLILIRRDANFGWGSEGASEINLKMTGFNVERYVRTASGALISRANQTITANAGGGQGSATEILSTMCRVSTVATTGDSVRLPTTFLTNTEIEVFNAGANAMDVFPASGDDLGAGVDTAVSVAVGALTRFKSMDTTVWVQCWTG